MTDLNSKAQPKKQTTPNYEKDAVGGVSFVPQPKQQETLDDIPNAEEIKRELMKAGLSPTQRSHQIVPTIQKIKKSKWSILRPLRTYKDDVAKALRESGGSKISIRQKEQDRTKKRLKEDNKNLTEEARIQKEIERVQNSLKQATSNLEIKPDHKFTVPAVKTVEETPKAAEITLDTEKTGLIKEAEQQLKQRREDETNRRPVPLPDTKVDHSTLKMVLLSFFFIAVGSGFLYGAYALLFAEQNKPPFLEINTLVFAEESFDISVEGLYGDELQNVIVREKNNASLSTNTIANINLYVGPENMPNSEILPAQSFLSRIGAQAPLSLSRSFDDEYMLGIHRIKDTEIFLILQPTFFENAFADMLVWEEYMAEDLSPLFTKTLPDTSVSKNESTIRTSRSDFEDKIIENKDARVLLNARGEIILLYSFVNKQTLIITTSKETLLEVFERMSAKRVSR